MGFIQRSIIRLVLMVVGRPWWTLGLAGLVLVVGCVLAWTQLSISTDQNKLFSPKVPFFQDYLRFVRQFPENEAIYVVIEPKAGKQPVVEQWTGLADAIAGRLRNMPEVVRSVEARVKASEMGPYGLLFEDKERLGGNLKEYQQFAQLLKVVGEKPGLDAILLGQTPIERFYAAMGQGKAEETGPIVKLVTESLRETIASKKGEVVLPDFTTLDNSDPRRLGYAYLPDESDPTRQRHILLVTVYHRQNFTSLTAISETVETIRGAVQEEAKKYPEFRVGLTGRPTLEAEEMRTTDTDTRRGEIIALIVVFIGLMVMLRSVWLAVVAELALAVGIGWTFGWATLAVGELNLLSIVFVIALIGIGMDYLVQILTRYRVEAQRYVRQDAIWARVFRYVSPPISTGCLGAAGAFFVSMFTDFRGAADLGIIAGGGLLLCLVAGYTVLPAILVLWPAKVKAVDVGERYTDHRPAPPSGWWKLIVPGVWVGLLVLGVPFALKAQFDPNLIKLQAPNLESVKLVDKLQMWSMVVLTPDLEQLKQARAALKDSPTVASTESVLDAYDNAAWLEAHQKDVPKIKWAKAVDLKVSDLSGLRGRVEGLGRKFERDKQTEVAQGLVQLGAALVAGDEAEKQERVRRLNEWQGAFLGYVQELAGQFSPPPLDVSKLPAQLRNHLVSTIPAEAGKEAGRPTYALYVYPRKGLWEREPLEEFVRDVDGRMEKVPGKVVVTGIASNMYYSTKSIEKSFYKATLYALLLIIVLVFLDLRRVGQTLVAISVLLLGLPMLVAIMGLFGVSWNFANFFALPILIGAGHEYGVFMIHRYRETVHNPRRVWRVWDVSDRALFLCAYVTVSSFGFFWAIGHHRGLRSLGLVMALGISCIYLATILVVRPMLTWYLGRGGVYVLRKRKD